MARPCGEARMNEGREDEACRQATVESLRTNWPWLLAGALCLALIFS
jgi:hypothetical protein